MPRSVEKSLFGAMVAVSVVVVLRHQQPATPSKTFAQLTPSQVSRSPPRSTSVGSDDDDDTATIRPAEKNPPPPRAKERNSVRERAACGVLTKTLKLAVECGDRESELRVFPLLVTGTGRTGTLFASDSFKAKGYDITHDNERIGKYGAAAWPLAMRETKRYDRSTWNTSGYAFPSFARAMGSAVLSSSPLVRFRVVLHQVREPLSSIASRADRVGKMYAPLAYSNPHLFRDVLEFAPSFPPPPELESWYRDRSLKDDWPTAKRLRVALFHFVFWNEFVDAYADARYRVEDFDVERVAKLAELPSAARRHLLRVVPKKSPPPRRNHYAANFVPRNLTWANLRVVSPFVAGRARALARTYGYSSYYDDSGGGGGAR